jgi:hypothetical protein
VDNQISGVVLFEQQALPGVRDLDMDTLALLLQNLSELSDDVQLLIAEKAPFDVVAERFAYLDRNIHDLSGAAVSLSRRLVYS